MSAPATLTQRIGAQTVFDTRTLLSNGEQLLVAIVLPALALLGLTWAAYPDLGTAARIDVVAPGVLALAVVSTAFTGQAIGTAFDRRAGVLRLLGTTPLGRGGLLLGRILAVLLIEVIQWLVLGGLALALGWKPHLSGLPWLVVGLLLGTGTFVSLAFLVAGTLRAEAVLALANLVWVLLLPLGLLLPVHVLPDAAAAIARWTPGGALGELLRGASTGAGVPGWSLLVLVAWCAVSAPLAARLFRWSD